MFTVKPKYKYFECTYFAQKANNSYVTKTICYVQKQNIIFNITQIKHRKSYNFFSLDSLCL